LTRLRAICYTKYIKLKGMMIMAVKTYNGLPEFSFATLPTTRETIKIKRGESGYYTNDKYKTANADELNETLGVTKAQAEAMMIGSMCGWHVEGADPANYDETGKFITE
jgi:hypothetical protein